MSTKNIDLAIVAKRVELLELDMQALKTMDQKELEERLKKIESLLYVTKEMLTLPEAAQYIGITVSQLYKLTYKCEIPFYKPHGKNIVFDIKELAKWMKRVRVKPIRTPSKKEVYPDTPTKCDGDDESEK